MEANFHIEEICDNLSGSYLRLLVHVFYNVDVRSRGSFFTQTLPNKILGHSVVWFFQIFEKSMLFVVFFCGFSISNRLLKMASVVTLLFFS